MPKPNSTGGKVKLRRITKQGDQYLRLPFVVGRTAIVKMTRNFLWRYSWVVGLLEKKTAKVVAVAVANKLARIACSLRYALNSSSELDFGGRGSHTGPLPLSGYSGAPRCSTYQSCARSHECSPLGAAKQNPSRLRLSAWLFLTPCRRASKLGQVWNADWVGSCTFCHG